MVALRMGHVGFLFGAMLLPCNAKAAGYALAIGLNALDPQHYHGSTGILGGCEQDARDMARISETQGLKVRLLLTKEATREAVLAALNDAAQTLTRTDLLVVSYSGHGGQIPDQNGDEADALDETWCLYDGELLDDELYQTWTRFKPGVRILLFSDSCHSGSVSRALKTDFTRFDPQRQKALDEAFMLRVRLGVKDLRDSDSTRQLLQSRQATTKPAASKPTAGPRRPPEPRARALPPAVAINSYLDHRQFYDALGKNVPKEGDAAVRATVVLLSGCRDDQLSWDLGTNGLFTSVLIRVWNDGLFQGDHRAFHKTIKDGVLAQRHDQEPQLLEIGSPNQGFLSQRPWTIRAPQ